jgi:hypothetical protein
MLSTKYAVACLTTIVVFGLPLSAGARLAANGTSLNGVSLNGLQINGTGLQLNPDATQGIVRVEGGRLVIQSTSTN